MVVGVEVLLHAGCGGHGFGVEGQVASGVVLVLESGGEGAGIGGKQGLWSHSHILT